VTVLRVEIFPPNPKIKDPSRAHNTRGITNTVAFVVAVTTYIPIFLERIVENMSTKEMTKSKFQAKDGLWYPTYVGMATANRLVNEEHLRSKGLLEAVMALKKPKKTASPKHRPNVVTPTPVRRSSRRMRQSPPENKGVDIFFEERPRPPKKIKISRPKMEALSDQDYEKLRNVPDWLEDMEEWLKTVPHGNGNKVVSQDNAASVMRQVRKLVSGVGITYHHWSEGTFFKRGKHIRLNTKMEELYDQAVEMEQKHGKDLGNGWLLRHPIRKMELYQEYQLEQGT
jgi:hypothetical protein